MRVQGVNKCDVENELYFSEFSVAVLDKLPLPIREEPYYKVLRALALVKLQEISQAIHLIYDINQLGVDMSSDPLLGMVTHMIDRVNGFVEHSIDQNPYKQFLTEADGKGQMWIIYHCLLHDIENENDLDELLLSTMVEKYSDFLPGILLYIYCHDHIKDSTELLNILDQNIYAKDSKDHEVLLLYGWLYFDKKEFQKAEDFIRRSLNKVESSMAYMGLAAVHDPKGDLHKTVESIEMALVQSPFDVKIHIDRIRFLTELESNEKMIAAIDEMLNIISFDIEALIDAFVAFYDIEIRYGMKRCIDLIDKLDFPELSQKLQLFMNAELSMINASSFLSDIKDEDVQRVFSDLFNYLRSTDRM